MQFFKNNKRNQILKNKQDTEQKIKQQAFLDIDELLASLETSRVGLSVEEAEHRIDEYGENVITIDKRDTLVHKLLESVINPFNVVLIIIAAISYVTDVLMAAKADYLTVVIIMSLVLISSIIAFVQNYRSNAAAEKLSEMISNKADVLRDGALTEIPMSEVAVGDIVKLSAGDMLPADVRFLFAKDTFISQAALTGESNPVEKFVKIPENKLDSLTDLCNIGFMGSNVVSGSAMAVVLSTGNYTYFGSMAKSLSGQRSKNSFERGVDSVSHLLIRMMLLLIPVIFLINGIFKGDWQSSLLFAISVAVGLTPEMLPVIMTSTLAKGAVELSKHKVIVRSLSAIQTFGEMDILCTDKTGTLTEDKIVLEKYINLHGEDDDRILRHAYLNSYFQTGLKNLIDLAIINRAEKDGLTGILPRYNCVDEIPFDFSRRRMSVVLESGEGKRQLITKGAVEEIMSISKYIEIDGKVIPIDERARQIVMETYNKFSREGLRMVAIGQKNEVPSSGIFSVEDERDIVLIGFVGFLDPPKESAKSAITALKEHGVRTVVLTGDSEGVAVKVCNKVGVKTSRVIIGSQIEAMTDSELLECISVCDLFAKLSPTQKTRVVSALQSMGHTVGYMGDGINDAQALRQADVGISVDSAVDIAKESADIILLEKDLMVLEAGAIKGRRTFGNIIKYIKMAASGNFGNMISVVAASIFLPFLPMLPVQLLTQNLLCDFSQMGMPFDDVDDEYIKSPRKWDTKSIRNFMNVMGPLSSVFDILCFAVLWWIIGANSPASAPLFHCGWFVFGTLSQVLVIYMIRTEKIPFIQSKPSKALMVSTSLVTLAGLAISFTSLAGGLDMAALPLTFLPWLALLLFVYMLSTQALKVFYIRRYGEWI